MTVKDKPVSAPVVTPISQACSSVDSNTPKGRAFETTTLLPVVAAITVSQPSPAKDGEAIPPPGFAREGYGRPKQIYWYRDQHGRPVAVVLRYENASDKTFGQCTLVRSPSGTLAWLNKAPPVPCPVYNLHLLITKPDAPVVICEGEKSADAARKLFPNWVIITTIGGSKAPHKSDFSFLAGRCRIIIWPDNDEPGQKYAQHVAELIHKVDAVANIEVFAPFKVSAKYKEAGDPVLEEGFEPFKGWDAADAVAEGWTPEHLRLHMAQPGSLRRIDVAEASVSLKPKASTKRVVDADVTEIFEETSDKKSPTEWPPMLAMRLFVKSLFAGLLLYDGSGFRAYRDGYWWSLNQAVDIERPLLKYLGIEARPKNVKDIIELMKMKYAQSPEDLGRPQHLICLLNGALDACNVVLLPHSPDHCLSNRLEVEWTPEATCELWLQTLDEVFVNDPDKAEKIAFLQEFMGYCLIPDTSKHKFLWMVGGGGNGKSLVLAIIERLVGKENVSHAQIERLQEKFVRAELKGKLVNISSEMSSASTVSDGYLKQIVGGDMIEAERKYQPSFSFRPYARLIGATNELPRLLDHSDGFFRRAIILTFNRKFAEAEQDRTREARLLAELPGILVWAVAGLQRLQAVQHFTIPQSSIEALERYRVDSNPLQQFVEEYLTVTQDERKWVKAAPLYKAFKHWCLDSGYHAPGIAKFKNQLKTMGFVQQRDGDGYYWLAAYSGSYVDYSMFRTEPGPVMSPLASQYTV